MRPAGVEPTSSAPEADALSIELRARKSISLFYQNKSRYAAVCVPSACLRG